MPNKQNYLPFFAVFFGLSSLLILFGTTGIYNDIVSIFNKTVEPGKSVTNILTLRSIQNKYINKINEENLKLKKDLTEKNTLINENLALKSQFESTTQKSSDLLPATVVGYPGFIPGVTLPDFLIINVGEKDGIKTGDTVLSNNFLVGKIIKTYPNFAKIELITNKNSSFIAKLASDADTNGILKGDGNELVLDNVLLITKLEKDTPVLTKGDKNETGNGFPPDINIGKISTIEKKQSDLFQKAKVVSPIDFKNLNMVFVMRN